MKKLFPLLFKVIFFAVLLVVTFLMLMPVPAGDELFVNDKIAHIAVFFVLSVFIDMAYRDIKFLFGLALALLAYGITIEVLQGWSGYRTFSVLDLVADTLGISVYAVFQKIRLFKLG